MNKLLLVLILVISANNLLAGEFIVPQKTFNSTKPELFLRKSFKGNFTNSGHDEYIAFYTTAKKGEQEPLFSHVRIFVVNKGVVLNEYGIDAEAIFPYDGYALQSIKKLEKDFGKWNGYFYLNDLNGNGRNELFLFEYCGIGHTVRVYEFIKDGFISVADTANDFNITITVDAAHHSFTLVSPREPEDKIHEPCRSTFRWNSANNMYEMQKAPK